MFKKIIATILLICFMLFCGGYFIFYLMRKAEIKNEMKVYLKNNPTNQHITKFSFNVVQGKVNHQSFSWEELNREFNYKGCLYDIISIKYTNNLAEINCIADNKEDALQQILIGLHSKEKDTKQSHAFSFLKVVNIPFLVEDLYKLNFLFNNTVARFQILQSTIVSRSIHVLDKPPILVV